MSALGYFECGGCPRCYRTICAEGARLLGPHDHPEITLHTVPLAAYMRHVEADRWDEVGTLLLTSAATLARAGAELLICPDNTIHQAVDLVRERAPLPWLRIVEEAAARRYAGVGILGTRYLMEGPVYPRRLSAYGIAAEIPDAPDRERINRIIFDDLVYGRLEERAREYFQVVIRGLGERGCDAVVLGCTEIPLLVSDADSGAPGARFDAHPGACGAARSHRRSVAPAASSHARRRPAGQR